VRRGEESHDEDRQLAEGILRAGRLLVAACTPAQVNGQTTRPTGDFTNAMWAEVRDASGQIVLRGQFVLAEGDDDDVERQAVLEPTGVDADARGEAEVEFDPAAPAVQEIEFEADNLEPRASYTVVIDGIDIGTAAAEARGTLDVEVDVPMQ
jgi:hypothetical protein